MQYTHTNDYPDFYHYGGIYPIYPYENKTCFHFHTEDDDEFEGNENFAIKLFSFTPINATELEGGSGSGYTPPSKHDIFDFDDRFDSYHHHDDEEDNTFSQYRAFFYSEHRLFDTYIPEALSTIHVTIVDNDEGHSKFSHYIIMMC